MRTFFITSLLFIGLIWPTTNTAQTVTFSDNFEDEDLSNAPTWNGNSLDFIIVDDNTNKQLRLNAAEAGSSYLTTFSTTAFGSWEFFVRLDFSPSGSNNLKVFLASDQLDLSGTVNGFVLRAGESGSDDVFRLVRYEDGAVANTILSGTTDISSGGAFQVVVKRSTAGEWTLNVSPGYGSVPLQEGTGFDDTHISPNYFGFIADYTSSRTDRFYFDDITVTQSPIAISALKAVTNHEFEVYFTQNPDPSSVSISDFSINNGIGTPNSVVVEDKIATITYATPLTGGNYTLAINNISDQSGNNIPSNSTVSFSLFDPFLQGDIIINEFNYTEPAGLSEYVELKNMTSKRFNLSDWKIADNNSESTISSDSLILGGDELIVITSDTTTLFNSFGDRNYVLSNLPVLNNTGDTIQLLTKSGGLADSLTYTPSWGGDNVALERRSGSAPTFYQENWGNALHPYGGSPALPNEVSQDKIPPELTEFEIVSGQRLKLIFNERLETESANKKKNFNLTNSSIKSVSFTSPDTVELTLETNLQNNQDYILTVSGVKDIFGNIIVSADTSMTYYKISPASSDDVFINEFNYAPVAGSTEYVEIHNPTTKSFNLQGWTLSDNRDSYATISNSYTILPPGGFVILAPDNTLHTDFPDITLVTVSSFPALNNSGDQIRIRDSEGTLLDSLQYRASWGGDEIALERRTTDVSGIYNENWGDAPNGFGTPGSPNKIDPDKQEPFLENIYSIDASTLQLVFSEQLSSASTTDHDNYQITPTNDIRLIVANKDSVRLYLNKPMVSGNSYSVTVSNISDIFGNSLASINRTVEFLRIDQAQPGDIVINEILYTRSSGDKNEFIEIFNTSNKNIDLSSWKVGDAAGNTPLNENIQLLKNDFLVLTGNKTFSDKLAQAHYITGFPSLNNSGDAVYLQNKNGITIDSLQYSSSWGGKQPGISIERKDPLAASNDAANWQSSTDPSGSTAGMENAGFEKDNDPPKVIFSKQLSSRNIQVHFNEFIALNSNLEFLLSSKQLDIVEFNPTNGNKIILSDPSRKSNESIITVNNISDVRGNTTESTQIPVSYPMQPDNLVINEIMYNPLSDNEDNLPDQSEYLELRNTKNYAVSLEGLQLHDAPDEDGNLRILTPVNTIAKWLPAKGMALIYADQTALFTNSKIANFFKLEDKSPASIIHIDRSTLSLASTGDAIYLADSAGTTIDSVYYDESWQNPNIIDTRGIALERIAPAGPSNISTNWGSSVNPKGGTPGAANSIYQEQGITPARTGINFTPNPFTPDNDGVNDYLFIDYKLNHQDYLIKVHIYDRYGRHIRKLADSESAGLQGQLIWDGRTDDGSRNRIGIYIVVFEAYNSATGKDQAFKKTVVLARKLH